MNATARRRTATDSARNLVDSVSTTDLTLSILGDGPPGALVGFSIAGLGLWSRGVGFSAVDVGLWSGGVGLSAVDVGLWSRGVGLSIDVITL
jgi:hypothetical protein